MRSVRAKAVAGTAVALAALTAVSACGSGTTKSSPGGSTKTSGSSAKIAFLMPDEASTRYDTEDAPLFKKYVKAQCAGCQVTYLNASADASKQQQQANSVLAQGVKVLVLDPVDSTAAATIVATAQSQGVKVITYDRPVPKKAADFYISFDNQQIGNAIATSLGEHLKSQGKKNVLEVNGSPTDAAAQLIKKGIHAGLKSTGMNVLAEYDTPDWTPSKAQDWVSGQISKFGPKIQGVVAANDGTGGGTIAAFKAAAVNPVPPVTGNDATPAGLQLIISGQEYNTYSKPIKIVAKASAEAAVQFINGKTPTPQTTLFNTPTNLYKGTVVTQKNIKSAIFDSGLQQASKICTSQYAAACKKLGIM